MKYLVRAKLEVDGRVDKHDVIGAIFGLTEGLLGSEYNLEELQGKDKIGRIHVDIKYQGTKTVGSVSVPTNLSRVETAIVAAMLETVDKIGPYNARIRVEEIKDLRAEKIERIIVRAKEILKKMKDEEPDIKEIINKVVEERPTRIIEYGPDRLPAGPSIDESDTIILVEGRADVINLLKYGYTNVIALEGAKEKIPETIRRLAETKKIILFVDGDHGGELILKTVLPQLRVDYVARAPSGKEVEQLTGREITTALSQMKPAEAVLREIEVEKPKEAEPEKPKAEEKEEKVEILTIPKKVVEDIEKLKGTLEAVLYDKEWKEVRRVKVRDLFNVIQEAGDGEIHAVVFDGIITQRLLDIAEEKGVSILIGARMGSKISQKPGKVRFLTFGDIT